LTAPTALDLQEALMRHSFQKYLGLDLTQEQSLVLRRYGGVSLAVKDLLEYCGCPEYMPAHETLGSQLAPFVNEFVQRRHGLIVERKRFWNVVREHLLSAEWLLAPWDLARSAVIWIHRARGDARERLGRLKVLGREQERFRPLILDRVSSTQLGYQRELKQVLAFEMYFSSLVVLLEECSEVQRALAAFGVDSHESNVAEALTRAVARIEYSLDRLTDG
jgi:hypothetical protein